MSTCDFPLKEKKQESNHFNAVFCFRLPKNSAQNQIILKKIFFNNFWLFYLASGNLNIPAKKKRFVSFLVTLSQMNDKERLSVASGYANPKQLESKSIISKNNIIDFRLVMFADVGLEGGGRKEGGRR